MSIPASGINAVAHLVMDTGDTVSLGAVFFRRRDPVREARTVKHHCSPLRGDATNSTYQESHSQMFSVPAAQSSQS